MELPPSPRWIQPVFASRAVCVNTSPLEEPACGSFGPIEPRAGEKWSLTGEDATFRIVCLGGGTYLPRHHWSDFASKEYPYINWSMGFPQMMSRKATDQAGERLVVWRKGMLKTLKYDETMRYPKREFNGGNRASLYKTTFTTNLGRPRHNLKDRRSRTYNVVKQYWGRLENPEHPIPKSDAHIASIQMWQAFPPNAWAR